MPTTPNPAKPSPQARPRLLEGWLAGGLAVGIGVSGVAARTTELATILFTVSLAGLLVLLAGEARARRRWTLR